MPRRSSATSFVFIPLIAASLAACSGRSTSTRSEPDALDRDGAGQRPSEGDADAMALGSAGGSAEQTGDRGARGDEMTRAATGSGGSSLADSGMSESEHSDGGRVADAQDVVGEPGTDAGSDDGGEVQSECPVPADLASSTGAPCQPEGRLCEYASSSACGSNLRCEAGQWVEEQSCIPDQECPTDVPDDAAACRLDYPPSGPLHCSYDQCPTARWLAICDGAAWTVTQSPCAG